MITSRFEENTLPEWHKFLKNSSEPVTVEQVKEILNEQLAIFEALESSYIKCLNVNKSNKNKGHSSSSYLTTPPKETDNSRCPLCDEEHMIYRCNLLKTKGDMERLALVKSENLCSNCLGSQSWLKCTSQSTCSKCKKRHHTLLHFRDPKSTHFTTPNNDLLTDSQEENIETLFDCNSTSSQAAITHFTSKLLGGILLATAIVKKIGENGMEIEARALIDPCSQASFLTESLCQRLRLKTRKVHMPISSTGGLVVQTANKTSQITIRSRVHPEFSCPV